MCCAVAHGPKRTRVLSRQPRTRRQTSGSLADRSRRSPDSHARTNNASVPPIDLLADEPRPPNCVALVGEDLVYRVRVGDHRIVYEVVDSRLVNHVVRVGYRRDVSRDR
ncbi:MAG: type II toxin-antitoxin system RelE family toxin [Acidimicrobiales bacterium]